MSYSSTKMADVFREPLSTRGFVTWAKKIRFCFKKLNFFKLDFSMQCLGSRSIGSARFWLPGSGSGYAKICGSTDSDPKSFFCSFWLIFFLLDQDPWIRIFLRIQIRIQEAKILRIQRIRILSTDY